MRYSLILLISFASISSVDAQFPNKLWEYYTGAPTFGSAAAADLDKDGFYEIVFSTYTNDGRVHCLNAEDGSMRWTYDIGGCGDVAALIYDVDNDDTLDVIVNGSCNPTIFCINGFTGKLKWSTASGGGDSPPTVADLDGDGKPEIAFGNFSGQLRILNGEDGSTNKSWQIDSTFGTIQTDPTLVDIDGDGSLEIIVANYFNVDGPYVWCLDYPSGAVLWTYHVIDTAATFSAYHGGTVADMDGDSLDEYVVGLGNGTIVSLNVEDGSVSWTRIQPQNNFSALASADLDHDGLPEIVFCSSNPGDTQRIGILSGESGLMEWFYVVTFNSFRGVAIADVNGNGQLDLVSGHFNGKLRVVEPYVGLIWEHDLKTEFSTSFPYLSNDCAPLIADFDQNGTVDVFIAPGYGTYTPDSLNTGKAFLFEAGEGLPVPNEAKCQEWLMFRQDVERSGNLSAHEASGDCDTSTAVMDISVSPIVVYPNPSSGIFRIQSDRTIKGYLEVYNSVGVLVYRQEMAGNWADINLSSLSAGFYEAVIIEEQKRYSAPLILY